MGEFVHKHPEHTCGEHIYPELVEGPNLVNAIYPPKQALVDPAELIYSQRSRTIFR
jgi:hypothetical protein